MKPLRLRTPKPYVNNNVATQDRKSVFYLIAEGPTEESYFKGILNNRVELEIRNNIHVEIVPKEEGDENMSHPYQLVMAALTYKGRLDEVGNEIKKDKWKENCKWDYQDDVDKVYVIFDRDYRHLEDKLDKIYELCKKHNIYIGISNPNFELWLLMHFPNIDKYDKDMLLKNPKNLKNKLFSDASKDKKYLEILVSKVSGGYTKGNSLKFERFVDGVDLAIEQEHLFCEDDEALQDALGSNIGRLLQEMKS